MDEPSKPIAAADIARAMRDMDIAMFATRVDGALASRPMSNNRDVDFDGTSRFFTRDSSNVAQQVEADPAVVLDYSGEGQWLSLQGTTTLVRDRERFAEHWVPDLDRWFEQGIDTPDLVMIEVTANRVTAWGRIDGAVEF